MGTAKLGNNIILKNVLCVPEFKHNLLSVSRLTEDSECRVIFYAGMCLIQDLITQKIKAVGKTVKGLYRLVKDEGVDSKGEIGKPSKKCKGRLKMTRQQSKMVHDF